VNAVPFDGIAPHVLVELDVSSAGCHAGKLQADDVVDV
jgi:hypothetical protein